MLGEQRGRLWVVLVPVTMGKAHGPKALTTSSPIQFTSIPPAPRTVPGIQ